ncbi:hypothetical protein L1765_05575 [Microaerobacter geothermalis]|nr:hypothetical protein [Microaerobacter geothermalis]
MGWNWPAMGFGFLWFIVVIGVWVFILYALNSIRISLEKTSRHLEMISQNIIRIAENTNNLNNNMIVTNDNKE